MLCSDGAFHPLPPAAVCIVLPVKPVNGFRRVRTVLGPLATLSALQADILVRLPLAFALTLLATFSLEPLPCSCSCFASTPSRDDQIFRTCDTSCHRAAAVRRSPSVLCSSHWLHDASGKLPTLLPLHARHPQALVERGPTSGISQNSTTSTSQALCPLLDSERSPHASHLRSSHPRLVRTTPDHAPMPRASQACLQRSRIKASSKVALLFST